MNDREIDELFARPSQGVDAEVLSRVSASISQSLTPVRPLFPGWMLAAGLALASALVAILSAAVLGFYGIKKLSGMQCGVIFSVLAIIVLLLSLASVGAMTPGSRQWMNPFALVALAIVGWMAIGAIFFQDYGTGRFVAEGVACFLAGLAAAVVTGCIVWSIMRLGYVVNPGTAGLVAGSLAGVAGLAALELHCPIFLAPHILVWHTAVVPMSALAGLLLGRLREHLR